MVLCVVDSLFIDTPIVGVCNCSVFCFTLLYVHSSIAIILMGKRELVALLNLYSWCLVMVEWLYLAVPWGCLRFVIVVFPDHTHLLFRRNVMDPITGNLSSEMGKSGLLALKSMYTLLEVLLNILQNGENQRGE